MGKRTVSGGVIIRRNSESKELEVLLIQRAAEDNWPLRWETPRGKCDKEGYPTDAPTLAKCLRREVKEESGLDVEVLKFIDKFNYVSKEGTTTQYNFLCRMKDPEQKVKISFEHETFKWVSHPGIILLQVSTEEMKSTILKAMKMFEEFKDITVNTSINNTMGIKENYSMDSFKTFKFLKENEETNNKKLMDEGFWKQANRVMKVAGAVMTAVEITRISREVYNKYNLKCNFAHPVSKKERVGCKIKAMDEAIDAARRDINHCEYPSCREEVMIYIQKLQERKKKLQYSLF